MKFIIALFLLSAVSARPQGFGIGNPFQAVNPFSGLNPYATAAAFDGDFEDAYMMSLLMNNINANTRTGVNARSNTGFSSGSNTASKTGFSSGSNTAGTNALQTPFGNVYPTVNFEGELELRNQYGWKLSDMADLYDF